MNKSKWRLAKPLLTTPKDERYKKYVKQIKTRGFADDELWNLDRTIAEFILPRLVEFAKNGGSVPFELYPIGYTNSLGTKKQVRIEREVAAKWEKILNKMIRSFELYNNEKFYSLDRAKYGIIQEGLDLFSKYFMNLWN